MLVDLAEYYKNKLKFGAIRKTPERSAQYVRNLCQDPAALHGGQHAVRLSYWYERFPKLICIYCEVTYVWLIVDD